MKRILFNHLLNFEMIINQYQNQELKQQQKNRFRIHGLK